MKNRFLFICVLLVFACTTAGCANHMTGGTDTDPTPVVTVTETPKPTEEPVLIDTPAPTDEPGTTGPAAPEVTSATDGTAAGTLTPSPTPVPQEAVDEAVRIAALHGLTEDKLHGEYALFLDFSKAAEANKNLNEYKETLYRIFPVIADNTAYIDREYLLKCAAELSIIDNEISGAHRGEYHWDINTVMVNTIREEPVDHRWTATVFHELMHFVDHCAGSDFDEWYYLLDDKVLTFGEFLELSDEDMSRAEPCLAADYIIESGAELFTAKYFSGATQSYYESCQFLSGLEYIYGTERIKELFFSTDSDVKSAKIFFDAGYSYDRYEDATESLNWLTYPERCIRPDNYISPEEILTDLYKSELGDGWETDREFRYILDTFTADWDYCERLNAKVYADLNFTPVLLCSPPAPVIIDGEMTLGAYATWTDPNTKRTVNGAITAGYDFEKEKPVGYRLIDMEEMENILFRGAYDIGAMTLREKILQMCVITPEQLGNWNMTSVGENELAALRKYPVGGVIFFEDQLQDPDQTRNMLSKLQEYAREAGLPRLFLCVDEEGGKVARIANNPAFNVKNPGPMKDIETVDDAAGVGRYIGKYLSDLGFNVDFAPDADVLTAPGSKIIGNRSFGDDPQKVTEYAAAVSDGLHEYGILSCFKHFPGHGAVEADTHEGLAYTDKSLEDLMACEIIPFAKAGDLGIDMVMAAHISVPAILGDNTPCSLSEYMLTTILKERLGYKGLVITDALNMGAVTKDLADGEAAVMAVKAGVDILLMPPDLDAAADAIEAAVTNGEIAESRINEAVEKILAKKLSGIQ